MKCQQGELAQVTRNSTGHPCRDRLIGGTIIRLMVPVRVNGQSALGDAWTYAGPLLTCPMDGRPCAGLAVIPDDDLEPLPGQASGGRAMRLDWSEGVAHG